MTPGDADLETRLRGQRERADAVPPPPVDLLDTVRTSARAERRRRWRLAGACLTAGLLLAALPEVTPTVLEDLRGQPGPAPSRQALLDLPPRGSLAHADEWRADVAALDWDTQEVGTAAPPVAAREVVYAADVPGLRVALVLGRTDGEAVLQAWFAGPVGADAADMTLLQRPAPAAEQGPLSMWDVPDPAVARAVVVVVASPGDRVEVRVGRTVTADGETRNRWAPVAADDGAGAVTVEAPATWQHGAVVRVAGEDGSWRPALPQFSTRAAAAEATSPGDVADPRGLRRAVPEAVLELAVHHFTSTYGESADRLGLTLLAGGPVAGTSTGAFVVAATFPSGATATYAATYPGGPESAAGYVGVTVPAPAGGRPDRVLAVRLAGVLLVSGPDDGVAAVVRSADGTGLAVLPLDDGAGAWPLPGPDVAEVDVLDGSGRPLASGPVDEAR